MKTSAPLLINCTRLSHKFHDLKFVVISVKFQYKKEEGILEMKAGHQLWFKNISCGFVKWADFYDEINQCLPRVNKCLDLHGEINNCCSLCCQLKCINLWSLSELFLLKKWQFYIDVGGADSKFLWSEFYPMLYYSVR